MKNSNRQMRQLYAYVAMNPPLGVPQVGEITRVSGVTPLSIKSLILI